MSQPENSKPEQVPEIPLPIEASGIEHGIPWVVARHSFGHCNGYVQLPDSHPWYLRPLSVLHPGIKVHGGITGGFENGWMGFDTMHAFDVWLGVEVTDAYANHPAARFWSVEKVVEEVKSLARQAARAVEAGVFEI